MSAAPVCPYCGATAIIAHRQGEYRGWVWECKPCDARVSCHPGTKKPMGTLANLELRKARGEAHRVFDARWQWQKRHNVTARTDAYAWLAKHMNLKPNDCHIGMFDLAQCRRVVEICTLAAFADLA